MSKVLLIGNGPSAIEKKLGKRIDSDEFDKIIRINRWKFDSDGSEHKKDYSEYIGTRCDYWVINDLHLTQTKIGLEKCHLYEKVFVSFPKFKQEFEGFQKNCENVTSIHPNINFIYSIHEDNINSIVDFKPNWPTTGIAAISWAISSFDEVFIYGYDCFDLKYNTQHYFEDENTEYGKNPYKEKRSDHTPSKEKTYIKHMIENNKLKIL